jgi:hypothetical protein
MIQITDTVQFDASKPLSSQTTAFQNWYNSNVSNQINAKLKADSLDAYQRPVSYTVTTGQLTVTVSPVYIYQDSSNWACSNFNLTIKEVQ